MSRTHVPAGARSLLTTVHRLRGGRAALAVAHASAWALVLASVHARGRPRLQNAVRHFAWSAWLTGRYGADLALAVGADHERHTDRPLDSEADTRNNAAGRAHGERHPVDRPTPVALWRLLDAATAEWQAGRLWMVEAGEVVASPGSHRPVGARRTKHWGPE